ncbi:MAG: hypothetical protein WKF55_02360 [Gemmatimonadaceae bacterium]
MVREKIDMLLPRQTHHDAKSMALRRVEHPERGRRLRPNRVAPRRSNLFEVEFDSRAVVES